MASSDYEKALRLGQKEYRSRLTNGEYPYLPVLDDLLSHTDIETRTDLGLVDIPLELIVGTSTQGRTTAFAGNFMPLLEDTTEFALKWTHLYDSMLDIGQRDPVKAYEFMNRFYIVEGNKRVSVSKFLNGVSVYGTVTRYVPKYDPNDLDIVLYYEFLDFYKVTGINYIEFSKEGSFKKLMEIVAGSTEHVWTSEEKAFFRSSYLHFSKEYDAKGGKKLSITKADAMLAYITIYGYPQLLDAQPSELRTNLSKIWDEFLMHQEEEPIALVMQPNDDAPRQTLLSKLISPTPSKVRAAFIHDKSTKTSAWTYGHELGRTHTEQVFGDKIETCCIENVLPENAYDVIDMAIHDGYDTIFTTTPQLLGASLKAAIDHPDIRILNCSLNTSHRYIRTYYGRMYEAKFLTGAIAGALAENGRLGYIADYPIYGMTANINAFALGAKLVNPRAKVYLEWSTVKDRDIEKNFRDNDVHYISNKEMITPEHISRQFGLYYTDGSTPVNLSMPVWHWGAMYELIIKSILNGTWKNDDISGTTQAINYWWGMSAGVIDVIYSERLPIGTKRLINLLKQTICTGDFNPFSGALYAQEGIIQTGAKDVLTPEEIIKMDWLAENVIGSIPSIDELKEEARPIVLLQGVLDAD